MTSNFGLMSCNCQLCMIAKDCLVQGEKAEKNFIISLHLSEMEVRRKSKRSEGCNVKGHQTKHGTLYLLCGAEKTMKRLCMTHDICCHRLSS